MMDKKLLPQHRKMDPDKAEINARELIAHSGADTQESVLRQGELTRELLNHRTQVDKSIDDEEEGGGAVGRAVLEAHV